MMVTFISQCGKKALNRTRRVLDAFADRIGDNTWQTAITQEGLLAVKKLLRKTASKNTAVSCHWIRSRARSELVWVVGKRDKFNHNGIVPVNSTSKEVPMDIVTGKPVKGMSYANTHLQPLDQHLFAVGYVAEQLLSRFYPSKSTSQRVAFVAGCFHDIGKLDPGFQSWVIKPKNKAYIAEDGQHIDEAKFSFEKHPRHNEISALIYALLDDRHLKALHNGHKKSISHAVYWHHAKPFRANDIFKNYGDVFKKLNSSVQGEAWSIVIDNAIAMLNRVAKMDSRYRNSESSFLSKCHYHESDPDQLGNVEDRLLPIYKDYDPNENLSEYQGNTRINAVNNEIRACLITADRWVSSLSAEELAAAISDKTLNAFVDEQIENKITTESNLVSEINECLSRFPDDKRTREQAKKAQELAVDFEHIRVLAGAAGCGKTKIALDWARLSNAQQIIWVCPRVQICQGLFADLTSDQYLPNSTIELFTGEFKCTNTYENITHEDDYFKADIVITTIDQILSNIISHSNADRLINYLSAHIVFDEFHEYINMPAFNLLFAELIASKDSLEEGTKTLLVSATPHYAYLEKILDLNRDCDLVEMPPFNKSRYQFQFKPFDETSQNELNPLYQLHDRCTFVISNTAITAQKSFVKNQHQENAILIHSKFKKSDKQQLFEAVFEAFKRDGNRRYDVLRSGPIVQASLNISCDHMVSEITTAENTLQRLGRLDRFGANDTINQYVVAVPDTLQQGKGTGSVARFLSSSNSLESAKAWHSLLDDRSDSGEKTLSLHEIYQIYRDFYQSGTPAYDAVVADLIKAMKKSAILIAAKVTEPRVVIKPKQAEKKRAKISKNSLRGDSRFVQMAVCDLTQIKSPCIRDEYAYEILASETESIDNFSASLEQIRNTGLLDYLAQKHGRIEEAHPVKGIPKNKIIARKQVLESYARDAEYPLFLSYTPSDMDQKLGENSAHEEAIYYGVSDKQPIGAISIKFFNNPKD